MNTTQPQDRYQETYCNECGQRTSYATSITQGVVYSLIALATAVRNKARHGDPRPNDIHLADEIGISRQERDRLGGITQAAYNGKMDISMINNMRHVTAHGLATYVERGSGRYLLTPKGAKFLRGGFKIKKTAILDNTTGKQKGYYEPDGEVTLEDIMKLDPKGMEPFWWNDDYRRLYERIEKDTANQNQTKLF